MAAARIDEILGFWFGDGSPAARKRWFMPDPAFDAEIRTRFADDLERAARGELDGWREDPRGALALVILLDQFSRNVFRDDARAFAQDARAREVTLGAIARGHDRALAFVERAFLYMPLMHAEDRELQRQSVAAFGALADEAAAAGAAKDDVDYLRTAVHFAIEHAATIDRFGRYPTRNAALGRTPTAEELASQ